VGGVDSIKHVNFLLNEHAIPTFMTPEYSYSKSKSLYSHKFSTRKDRLAERPKILNSGGNLIFLIYLLIFIYNNLVDQQERQNLLQEKQILQTELTQLQDSLKETSAKDKQLAQESSQLKIERVILLNLYLIN
jgi:hypothetical protein